MPLVAFPTPLTRIGSLARCVVGFLSAAATARIASWLARSQYFLFWVSLRISGPLELVRSESENSDDVQQRLLASFARSLIVGLKRGGRDHVIEGDAYISGSRFAYVLFLA